PKTEVSANGNGSGPFLSTTKESAVVETNELLPFRPLGEALADAPSEPSWYWRGDVAPGPTPPAAGRQRVASATLKCGRTACLGAGEPFLGRDTRKAGVLL